MEPINEELLSKITIMIAEDDDNTRKGLEAVLRKYVKTVYAVGNGKEAFDVFRDKKPDLVLTDIQMPLLSGIELGRLIKKIDHEYQVIYITAFRDTELILDAISSGADAFIIKPIDIKKLLMVMTKCANIITAHKYAVQSTKLMQHIFDVQDNIVILTDGTNLTSSNKRFLEFFGYSTLKHFKEKYKCICEHFIKQDGFVYKKDGINWVNEIKAKRGLSKVKMFDRFLAKERIFAVKVTPFSNQDKNTKFVISFTDITE